MRDPHGYFTLAFILLAPLVVAALGALHLIGRLRASFTKAGSRSEALGLLDLD